MKTINGIPCNDYLYTPQTLRNRITFRFVTDDTNTPSSCTIRLGDTDPLTGETITDIGFFTEYHQLANQQVYKNLKAVKTDMSPKEKKQYQAEKAALAKSFEEEYGYQPNRADIREALADHWPKKYHLSIQEMVDDEGNTKADRRTDLSVPAPDPFDENTPDYIARLRELAATFTGRLADVYEALLVQYAGGKEKITLTSIAKKWHVSVTQISLDRDKIIRMIRNTFENASKESEDD